MWKSEAANNYSNTGQAWAWWAGGIPPYLKESERIEIWWHAFTYDCLNPVECPKVGPTRSFILDFRPFPGPRNIELETPKPSGCSTVLAALKRSRVQVNVTSRRLNHARNPKEVNRWRKKLRRAKARLRAARRDATGCF